MSNASSKESTDTPPDFVQEAIDPRSRPGSESWPDELKENIRIAWEWRKRGEPVAATGVAKSLGKRYGLKLSGLDIRKFVKVELGGNWGKGTED